MQLTSAENTHQNLLEKWRKAMDLVGPGPLAPHFSDAKQAVSWIPAKGLWLDLGAGAGFPGIALAARHPDAQVQLVESRQKRALFLRQVIRESGLSNAEVLHLRVEDLPEGEASGVISRAYKPPMEALKDAKKLLQTSGIAVLLIAKQEAPELSGMALFHVERYSVDGKSRRAVGYRKQG
jgi:16S rRNA (guanine527-N7)-methyltransferase